MFCIQYLDHDEGSCARWNELSNTRHTERQAAREHLRRIRATDAEDSMYSYRITEVDSREYFSQPTDCLEY
jgi:hypothetical protein